MDYPINLGILGGGQLAKMLALSAYRLGMNVSIIEKGESSPAGDMTKNDFSKGWNDKNELLNFINTVNIVTLENEFINPEILEEIEKYVEVYPSSKSMKLIQDKFIQKTTFSNSGIPVPDFEVIKSIEDAKKFGKTKGYPFVLKSRKMGYDGYGNATIKSEEEISIAISRLTSHPERSDLYAEKFVNFSKELAIMVARSKSGEIAVYPVVETIQKNHICNEVIAPAEINEDAINQAKVLGQKCVEAIDGIGVFGIEFFLTQDNQVLVNEIAPRPHNTGHYTIEACFTSQYENAIRAILDLPLGSTDMIKPAAAMVNLLGTREGSGSPENVKDTLALKNVWLHLYNKKGCRNGRKMGHITTLANNQKEAIDLARNAQNLFKW